jgi:hypothetical protein
LFVLTTNQAWQSNISAEYDYILAIGVGKYLAA